MKLYVYELIENEEILDLVYETHEGLVLPNPKQSYNGYEYHI